MNELKEDNVVAQSCHHQVFTCRFKKIYNILKYPNIILYYLYGVQRVTREHQAHSSKPAGQEIFTWAYGLRLFRHSQQASGGVFK